MAARVLFNPRRPQRKRLPVNSGYSYGRMKIGPYVIVAKFIYFVPF